jgi:4-diphosphocytidyl-2-C-methyl-D-erythritol kinase
MPISKNQLVVNPGQSALCFPSAKVNFGLRILGKRPDGYHDLQTVMLPIGWHDTLEIERVSGRLESGGKHLMQAHGLPISGGEQSNLVVRAFHMLDEKFDLPATAFHLVKCVPMGAGLGGGSSDGAAALQGLNALYELGLSPNELMGFAAELGSDCPFFIGGKPAKISGRGEQVQPWTAEEWAQLGGYSIALVCPGAHVNTADAFRALDLQAGQASMEVADSWMEFSGTPVEQWGPLIVNDFMPIISSSHPEIETALSMLKDAGALWTSLSGSGSTVFGVFESTPDRPTVPGGWPKDWHWWAGAL